MLRVVLDTNILISALGWKGASREILEKCINDKIRLLESNDLLEELINVLKRPKFDFIPPLKKAEFLRYLVEISEIIHPKENLETIKDDISDNKVLECAIEGNADYIISGDEHLLNLKQFKGIKIISAKEFVQVG